MPELVNAVNNTDASLATNRDYQLHVTQPRMQKHSNEV
jgi:hypothetical protein